MSRDVSGRPLCGMFVDMVSKGFSRFTRLRPCLLQNKTGCSYVRRAFTIRPLDGVRVLDLTRVLAGPFATMILGDLGAEVTKVERPGLGDDTRTWGPPFVGEESAYFLSVNRNKKSIAVNLKDPKGAKLVKELARISDVLVENYLPGKLDEMGLGYKQLSEVAPQLIYCSITGYGQTGPQSHKPGYDSIASAASGMMHITGPEDGEPVRPGVAMTDLATGLYAQGAVMAGLLQRQKTGRGVHIDCNLLSSQVACLSHIAANYLNAGKEARRWGTAHESIVPYQGFRTKDGYLVVAAVQINTNTLIHLHIPNPLHIIYFKYNMMFSEEPTAEWLRRFEGTGVPCGPINTVQQVFSNPQVAHNGLIMEMDHPTSGRIAVPGPAVRFSSFECDRPTPPPVIGQHTIEVLRDTLGYSDDVINQLLASHTVTQNVVH
uniref:Succinyl-CoA:glutarate-CoA transferase n=1 Tax=Electrophorus electricus TaxID=8005 RepID=A0A4W4EFJ7_ELEEL